MTHRWLHSATRTSHQGMQVPTLQWLLMERKWPASASPLMFPIPLPAHLPSSCLFSFSSFFLSFLFLPLQLLLSPTRCLTSIFYSVSRSQIITPSLSSPIPPDVTTLPPDSYLVGSSQGCGCFFSLRSVSYLRDVSWVSSYPTPSVLQKHPTIYPSSHFTLWNR